MDEFINLPDYQRMATDAENYIIWKLGSQTFTDIAQELGVSVQTIANRAKSFGATERDIQLNGRYRYLSMDEVFITRDSNGDPVYYWLLNDISHSNKSNNIRVDVGRKKEDVIERLLELMNPETIQAICIDMWKQYRDAISEALPHVSIVIDRFHVIQLAQKAMDNLRKKANVPASVKADMKKDASLFLKSMLKLSNEELDRLESYLKSDAIIEKAYFIVQELSGFYWLKDYDDALNYLVAWEAEVLNSGVKELINILYTVQNWLPYIMNYFTYRITSGKTEGKNNLLRTIDRMGFHYGIETIQACLYAHDRKQEYVKWQKRLRKQERFKASPSVA